MLLCKGCVNIESNLINSKKLPLNLTLKKVKLKFKKCYKKGIFISDNILKINCVVEMKLGKRIFLVSAFSFIIPVLSTNYSYGQDSCKSIISFEFGADLVNRDVWRGCELDTPPHIQPNGSITLNISEQNYLSLGLFASYGFTGGFAENDFSLEYGYVSTIGTFSATVSDYYFPYLQIPISNFNNDSSGAHTMEAAVAYSGNESFPFRMMVCENIHGYDPGIKSLYIEAGFFTSVNNVDVDIFCGIANGKNLWYGIDSDNLQLINAGISLQKKIKITEDYSLPVGFTYVINPYKEASYVIFKISI